MASPMNSANTGGVPPGFRFHPTDEELLLYYLKKKVSLEKFDLEVVREVDLNKIEPWDLQERCRIGATPQNELYFFSHKDRKYPTGSRTNRATNAGFWKATGRDKCIRTSYKKIGMRKTLVFYRGRAPLGQKTDWIMHEYRLEETDDDEDGGTEDGWVVCRVFKKKCFFKPGGSEGSSSHGASGALIHMNNAASLDASRSLYMNEHYQNVHHHNLHQTSIASFYKPEQQLALHYSHPYNSQIQVQDLLPNLRPEHTAYEFPVQQMDGCVGDQGREINTNDWAMINNNIENQISHQQTQQQQQRGGEMDLWGYGKD